MRESAPTPSADDFLRLSPKIRVLPIIHGSGDFAARVRDELLSRPCDCLAVPLPESFQQDVEEAISSLPVVSAVVQREPGGESFSYVPIDPCQGVIAAIRLAIEERIPRAFIDLETRRYQARHGVFPDPYALKRVSLEGFAAALLPAVPMPERGSQHALRIVTMAERLRLLEARFDAIILICSILDWPWIRDAYRERLAVDESAAEAEDAGEDDDFASDPGNAIQTFTVDPRTLIFFLGELPYITALYERSRCELLPDDNLAIDGVKELALDARDKLRREAPRVARRLTPQALSVYFRYVRNLTLMTKRLTPDLYTLIIAAKETVGDDFALAIAEVARAYAVGPDAAAAADSHDPHFRAGVDQAEVPIWGLGPAVSRLPGQATSWRSVNLKRRPERDESERWRQRWNPYGMCSWPPEDDRIESFQRHVRDQAKAILGADLARTEKFQASLKDGLDLRETLRNWHTGDLYVKVTPPNRGSIEAVVFLFDEPADPKRYVHRGTWYAEHPQESTLAFFATNPFEQMVGPGIARAEYGGALFLFPPRHIPDVFTDRRLDFADTLEDRLLAAALLHSKERHVALVSPRPPSAHTRRLAKRFGRKIIHIPLARFSGALIERLRSFHVLNGKHVRSYASEFIRDL